jgi:hypothetical protein
LIDEKSFKRGDELTTGLIKHLDAIHSQDLPNDKAIETMLVEDARLAVEGDGKKLNFVNNFVTFSPSSASKCERELYLKALKLQKDETSMYPYQRRWTRNGSAVHGAVQRDLLYGEKFVKDPAYSVLRTKEGRPAWEKNIKHVKQFEHNGVGFQLFGMMDGVLVYNPDGSKVGFEFKTKSTTLAAIGSYKMKDAQDSHKQQCIAYSLLFGIDEFIILYESLAKDSWNAGADAKPDLRPFYIKVTEEERNELLDKFATVAKMFYNKSVPKPDFSKCIFCPYKSYCEQENAKGVS